MAERQIDVETVVLPDSLRVSPKSPVTEKPDFDGPDEPTKEPVAKGENEQ